MMLYSKFGFTETLMTRMYLRKVAKYFRIMNSTSLDQDAVHHLLQVLLFFKRWHNNIEGTMKNHESTLKQHWKQFISKHTYKDLIRSIRGFIGLVSYVQLNHSDVVIVPRTTNQDDVENYFSLQRRIAGGEVTVQQYLEGNASLATDLLIKAEKNDLDTSSFIGSYSTVVTPNYVSVPLQRKKSIVNSRAETTQEHWGNLHQNDKDFKLDDEEVNNFHSKKDEDQLYRQVQQVFDYINVKSSSVIIGYGQRLVSILREEQNRKYLMQFLKFFNYKLRHKHFIQGNWHKYTLLNAQRSLRNNHELKMAWSRLLIQVNMTHESVEANEQSTTEVFGTICEKFSKRRCVTFLAIDQLNPRSEEQQSAIRQLLRTFEKASEKPPLSSKPTDKCFKCGEEGHWARECKKEIPHDSAWLQTQRCYSCGQYGHLKKDCKTATTNCKLSGSATTPKARDINTNHDPLTIQLLRLPEVNLKDHPKLLNIPPCHGSGTHLSERFLNQGSDAWKEARKGKVNGSRAACALGWRGREEMIKYAQEVKSGQTTINDINNAMRWGSMCEDHAVATYINGMPCRKFEKTGLWVTTDDNGLPWLAVSPDGIIDDDTVVEIKCPFMGGNPFPYRKVPLLYIPQCQLEMYATNTTTCHFVCWTPRRTYIYLIKRNEEFIQELLVHLKSFWNKALSGEKPSWNINLEFLKTKAQEISDQSILLKSLPSCRKENAMEHSHFNFFWQKNECTPKRKCHGCGKLQVICKLDPCDKKLPRTISNSVDTFQSYTYGFGQILNSCYIDTFLEAIYHPFTRQITPATTNFIKTTQAMDTILESIVSREQGKFHSSKMLLWSYLRNNTTNGHATFPHGQMAAISNVFSALCKEMSEQEKNSLFVTESLDVRCTKCNHRRISINTFSTYFVHSSNIHMTDITNSTYDPVRVIEKLLMQQDILCPRRSICLQSNDDSLVCGGRLVQSASLINSPFLMAIELDKDEGRPVQPGLSSKFNLNLKNQKYDLAAIIYHHNFHF